MDKKDTRMKYFIVFLMWLGFVAIASIVGEWVVSREVNGYLQLISFVGLIGVLMYITNETMNILFKNKEK